MPERTHEELTDLLTVAGIPGIGAARFRSLISRFGTPRAVLEADLPDLTSVNGISPAIARQISSAESSDHTRKQCDAVHNSDVVVIACTDSDFPSHLSPLDDSPLLLFVRGNVGLLTEPGVALVGTRKPTEYGRQVTAALSHVLAENGITVVSGMARGIDNRAHSVCLKSGGATIAVLGTGVDCVYPAEAQTLYDEILTTGAIVSELPMGTAPEARNFPRRNRIISGLSSAVVVVEAPVRSGALITAEAAERQGREVFAVPGRINDVRAGGTNRLIADGAGVVLSAEDLLQNLTTARRMAGGGSEPRPETMLLGLPVAIPDDVSEVERKILEELSIDPIHVDDLAGELGVTSSELGIHLTLLEMRQLVTAHAGTRYSRTTAHR